MVDKACIATDIPSRSGTVIICDIGCHCCLISMEIDKYNSQVQYLKTEQEAYSAIEIIDVALQSVVKRDLRLIFKMLRDLN